MIGNEFERTVQYVRQGHTWAEAVSIVTHELQAEKPYMGPDKVLYGRPVDDTPPEPPRAPTAKDVGEILSRNLSWRVVERYGKNFIRIASDPDGALSERLHQIPGAVYLDGYWHVGLDKAVEMEKVLTDYSAGRLK